MAGKIVAVGGMDQALKRNRAATFSLRRRSLSAVKSKLN